MLGTLHIEISGLQQPQQDVLHVVAHVTGLGEGGGVGNGKGNLQNPGQGLGKEGLAGAGGAQHQNVALLELHVLSAAEENALVVVVYRNGERHLRLILADDILVQHILDLPGRRQLVGHALQGGGLLVLKAVAEDAHAQAHALITNPHTGPLNHPVDLIFMLAAE